MGKKLEYNELKCLFEKGKNFSLTDIEYKEIIGKELPKDKTYLKNRSPLSTVAQKYGYIIEILDKPIIQRTINFKKMIKKE